MWESPSAQTTKPVSPVGTLQEEQSFGSYTIRTYRDICGEGSFEILKDDRQVYAQKGWKFYIGPLCGERGEKECVPGSDITGDGIPNIIVSEWTGGMHNDIISSVFEAGNTIRKLAVINGRHGNVGFIDMDGDGKLEVYFMDWTFAYWWTCFCASPAPEVILRYENGHYKIAADLMRKPSPSPQEMDIHVREVREGDVWVLHDNDDPKGLPPSELWGYMLDLIYSGNADSAWKYLDRAWPAGISGKERFVKAFRDQLAESPYWPAIRAMNRN